jgi:hypothetical protein
MIKIVKKTLFEGMNKLKLHEAIAVVLLNKPDRTMTFDEISDEIASRNLYVRPKDGLSPPSYQIKMRTTLAGGQYHHLFEHIKPHQIRLRNHNFDVEQEF